MRALLCLLAVALLAAAPVHSRHLKFDFPAPSPSPSNTDGPTQTCVDDYNVIVDNTTGRCGDGAKLSGCCTALAGLGQTCLQSIVDYMERTPEKHADTLKWLTGILKQCSDKPNTAGPTQQCVDTFNAFVDSGVCAKGASLSKCCAAMEALGSCLDDIEAAMEKEPEKYADTLASIKATRKECGGPGPSPNPEEPTEQCIADFNAAMDGPCGKAGTVDKCCAALSGLGSCLQSIATAMSKQGSKYAESLKWLDSMAKQCGSGPGPSPTPDMDEACLKGLAAAFDDGGACAGSSASACCDSLEAQGKDCLSQFLAYTKSDNITVHDAFVSLLQSCGWTITTSSGGARAAPEVTTQAMLRMKSAACPLCGAAKLEAPMAARRALAETAFVKLVKPATKVAPTAFPKALA